MVRRFVLFRPTLFAVLALTWSVGVGCASDSEARRAEAREAAREARPSHVQEASYKRTTARPRMTVSGEEGNSLNFRRRRERCCTDHFGEIKDCFHPGRRKRPQGASGRLRVALLHHRQGRRRDDVEIVESSIGNHAIERCIADIGLGVMFELPPPATSFPRPSTTPVEFRLQAASHGGPPTAVVLTRRRASRCRSIDGPRWRSALDRTLRRDHESR